MSWSSPSDWWNLGPVDFLLLALATWRLTSLLVQEEGPWAIFARLRYRFGVRFDEHSVPYGLNVLAEALICMWCGSVWVGALAALAYVVSPEVTRLICLPLALSGAAVLLNRMVPYD